MKKKNILVTGASCFIGYHLIKNLHNSGFKVFVTLSKKFNSYKGIQKIRLELLKKLRIKFYIINLANKENVENLINKTKPNYIFHMAADTTGLSNNRFSLEKSTTNNIKFIENLYSGSENKRVKIIIATTNAEYKNIEGKVNENSSCQPPFNAYGLSKLSATLRALQLAETKKLKTVVIRIFNPIGPYDSENKLLPQVIRSLKEKKPMDLSSCKHKRDFIYIDRLIDGMIKTLRFLDNTKEYKTILNLCYGKPTTIKTLIEKIANSLNNNKNILNFDVHQLRRGEPFSNYGDNTNARLKLKWHPGDIFQDVDRWLKKDNF
tara:strand:+ start:6355 stop:7314 length:960 start_codon:yes stop_codon:yes gene_type:complete